MRRLVLIFVMALGFVLGGDAIAQQLQWRESSRDVPGRSLTDPRQTDGIEIYGSHGVITIKTPRRIQVRVFTILGQTVSAVTLNPGTSELKIAARGIYVVKIGNITQKVVL
ncbi:MAG: T9SS type A sorting domain-containing protein [Bacteroidales bacterium]|nr:T9SS type A sorting domain-containing protein [Candidatus Sodaliphilus aphodohippi]